LPQALLPLVPDGATPLNDRISVVCRAGRWTYFCGVEPVFFHDQSEHASFRMFTSQLACQRACKQIEIVKAIKSDIVPRLLRDVPGQPSDEELQANRNLCRFVLVFDREGYSPVFFKEMWQSHRIACITYHKFPKLKPDGLVRSLEGKLNRQQCLFAAHTIRPETELDRYSEDDCIPRRDVDDADCASIISERR